MLGIFPRNVHKSIYSLLIDKIQESNFEKKNEPEKYGNERKKNPYCRDIYTILCCIMGNSILLIQDYCKS